MILMEFTYFIEMHVLVLVDGQRLLVRHNGLGEIIVSLVKVLIVVIVVCVEVSLRRLVQLEIPPGIGSEVGNHVELIVDGGWTGLKVTSSERLDVLRVYVPMLTICLLLEVEVWELRLVLDHLTDPSDGWLEVQQLSFGA